jgi:hypothetical protein
MDIRNLLIRFAIFNGVLMPRLLSEEEYDTEIDHCDFALDELERDILERPGYQLKSFMLLLSQDRIQSDHVYKKQQCTIHQRKY